MKKVLLIVAQKNFRDVELLTPEKILKEKGFKVDVASIEAGKAYGAEGHIVDVISVKDVGFEDYDFIGLIGGPGALSLERSDVMNLMQNAYEAGKQIGAICISSVVLAKAGLLDDVKATVWESPDRSTKKELEDHGATFVSEKIVYDKNILTGNGPGASEEWGKKIVEILSK